MENRGLMPVEETKLVKSPNATNFQLITYGCSPQKLRIYSEKRGLREAFPNLDRVGYPASRKMPPQLKAKARKTRKENT
jgi:hypothetical protein